jgi:chorismate dehydratase
VSKLRISVVQYLNTAPLIRGFTHGPLQALVGERYELSLTVPSQCAEALRTGAADIAIIPAIEYQRIVSQGIPLTVLPDLAIASKERVRSLLIISKVPIRQARRIALDPSSRSTQALVKILASKRWQISPEFIDPGPLGNDGENLGAALAKNDAALLIGDAALRIAIASEVRGVQVGPDGEWLVRAGVLDRLPQVHVYDVVQEWRSLTGLPAVLAVWAARNESFPNKSMPTDVAADFLASRDFGLTQIAQIATEAAHEMHLPEKDLRLYLEENIDYTLDAENLLGLQRFFSESEKLGLIGPVHPVAIADTATAARTR